MPNVAPGNRSSTAWASTWAVEWRIVNRPAVAVAGDDGDLVAVVRARVARSRSSPLTTAITAALARREPMAAARPAGGGAGGQRARRTVGQPDRDLVGHGARRYRRPRERSGTGCDRVSRRGWSTSALERRGGGSSPAPWPLPPVASSSTTWAVSAAGMPSAFLVAYSSTYSWPGELADLVHHLVDDLPEHQAVVGAVGVAADVDRAAEADLGRA